ncbi:YlxR family protein [Bacillaceae bacterium SIJ1]|uniref:RNase P modulator RnpM n=1 Tax=Litoribacterium kuwaitense TaxID=1398745 RepID=UPI0013EA03AC|nr:YlxR family protein [Litoribacterium kuwaitense]NGP44091.1 YlxR family protein [Litoribacterium kuwaitense]
MMKQKKVPMRKCIATQMLVPKKELVRIVRTPEGDIVIDETGKKSGRGAYLTLDQEAIEKARKKNLLANHLKADVPDAIYEQLLERARV